jgi:hypothetical protein
MTYANASRHYLPSGTTEITGDFVFASAVTTIRLIDTKPNSEGRAKESLDTRVAAPGYLNQGLDCG